MPKARVLAVDDQRYFRELIEGLLTSEGYAVRTAASGEEALHILERESFDILVTDLVMPGLDGGQLVATVKERNPDQDIVMVTGVVDVKTAVDAMKRGATDYILKPFDRNTLVRSLDQILQRRRLRDEHARLVAENLEYMEVLALYERAVGLFSTLAPQPLAERLTEALCLETRAQGGVLWLAEDPGESRLELAAAKGLIRLDEEPEELRAERLPDDLADLAREGGSRIQTCGPGGHPALWVAVRHAGQLVGLARLSDKLEGARFDDRDRAAAEKFAALGAPAVVNALRYRALERRSFRDPNTKAYTHAYFQDVVRNEIQKATRFGRRFSVVRVDLGAVGEIRREAGEAELSRWLEAVVHHASQALRSTDLIAVESESRFAALLPETDALGGAVLKHRIRHAIEESGVLDGLRRDVHSELALAVATFPTDGTQLEGLERALDERLEEHRASRVREIERRDLELGEVLEHLVASAEPAAPGMAAQVTGFLLQEVSRRAGDRGLLVVAPGRSLEKVVFTELARMREADLGRDLRTEVVVVASPGDDLPGGSPVTWVDPARLGIERPFLLYYGEGPAYALLGDGAAANGHASRSIFHTDDRALVEHLAFQLQRDLGLPLGA